MQIHNTQGTFLDFVTDLVYSNTSILKSQLKDSVISKFLLEVAFETEETTRMAGYNWPTILSKVAGDSV